jgi:peptide subunit release factor 1 (eRF1)
MTPVARCDLRALAELSGPDRAFLTLYLPAKKGLAAVERRLQADRALLSPTPDEAEHFEQNLRLAQDWWEDCAPDSGTVCLFVCWALGVVKAVHVPLRLPELVRVDSSPYVRPLAEFRDEYEDFAVVVADNQSAQVYLVSAARAETAETVAGGVKNAVKVGGWSQQRYRRRRENDLSSYAKEVGRALLRLDSERDFRRVVMVGAAETLRAIEAALPAAITRKAVESKATDLKRPGTVIEDEILALMAAQERDSEAETWDRIKAEFLRGGLAAVGIDDVAEAAAEGRIDRAVVCRTCDFDGTRCRACEHLMVGQRAACAECGSVDLFNVELVNECVEMLLRTSADVDFVDADHALSWLGGIAALLRY